MTCSMHCNTSPSVVNNLTDQQPKCVTLCTPWCFAGPGICSYYSGERKLSQWFDVSSYITLEPNSYSKRILTPKVLQISPHSQS